LSDQKIFDKVQVEMPPYENTTTGMWIDVPKDVRHFLAAEGIAYTAAIHSASHAFLNQFPMAADLRTECKDDEQKATSKVQATSTDPCLSRPHR
jgi:DEAD/DEAH box helicase domain-containing protein